MVSSVQCSVQFLRLGVTAAKAFNLNLRLIHLPLGFCSANTNKLASDSRQTHLYIYISSFFSFTLFYILHIINLMFRFRVVFVQVVPCISLVILNILLFSAMRRAEQRRRRLTINRTNNNDKKNSEKNSSIKKGTVGR